MLRTDDNIILDGSAMNIAWGRGATVARLIPDVEFPEGCLFESGRPHKKAMAFPFCKFL